MKSLFPLIAGLAGIVLATAVYAEDAKPASAAPAPQAAATVPAVAVSEAAAPTFTETELLDTWGWLLSQNIGLSKLDLTPEQVQAVIGGLARGSSGGELGRDYKQISPQLQQYLTAKHEIVMAKLKEESRKAEADFFAEVKKNPTVKESPTGLCYEIIAEGEGEKPAATSKVKVHYTGRLINGRVFDSSVQRGEPAEFELNRVIPGWTEGLQLIAPGGKAKLYIPSALAYGESGAPGIPPVSPLVFEVELLEVSNAPAAEAAPAPAPVPAQ